MYCKSNMLLTYLKPFYDTIRLIFRKNYLKPNLGELSHPLNFTLARKKGKIVLRTNYHHHRPRILYRPYEFCLFLHSQN